MGRIHQILRSMLCITGILAAGVYAAAYDAENVHMKEVRLTHPSVADPLDKTLCQVRDSSGYLLEYYLDVDSVICGDNQCEIITVRLTFDVLGNYLRYEFPDGGELTKRGHKKFTAGDHVQLHKLLSSADSILKDIAAKDVVSPAVAQDGEEVDGVSGATLLSSRGGIVPGAVYTCYTLWHWANGGVQEIIRELSAKEMTNAQLNLYLEKGTEQQASFAVEQAEARKMFTAETSEFVRTRMLQGSDELLEYGLAYFEETGSGQYYETIEELFAAGSTEQRVICLSALTSTELEAPPDFYDRMSYYLPELESYLEVHLFIGLLTYLDSTTQEVISNTMPLLENESFLISRKAFYFLKQQQLNSDQAERLELYAKENAGRL